jgi:hypothetical protein
MTFYDRFELAQTALSDSIRNSITNHHNGFFDIWLSSGDAAAEFCYAYQNIFKEYFGDYITEEVNAQLWFAGKNIVYAINTFIKIQEEYTLNPLLDFVETFLSEQLNDFENDYECSHWFYNDDSQEQNEDNPT